MEDKLKALCNKITQETQARLITENLGCPVNLKNAATTYKIKPKYTYIDVGSSGKYMVENSTGNIYGIKAYGVIHRGHFFGNLDTINYYYWGNYTAYKIN